MAMRISGIRSLSVLVVLVVLSSACRVGPRYTRPPVDVPAEYRGEPRGHDAGRVARRREVVGGVSRRGVAEAHRSGADRELRRAHRRGARPSGARATHDHARGSVSHRDGGSDGNRRANAGDPPGGFAVPASTENLYRVDATLTWEIDFWGKFRSATEAERANLLGAQWAVRAVFVSVVDLVAQGYFTLRELDLALAIARRTLTAREESLRLTRIQEPGGIVSMLDVRQAEQLVYTAASVITDTERLITQQENAISILLGQNPGPIPRGLPLVDQPEPPEVPAGLPSSLLERRPDIRQAEQALVAANARIGVAKAALYPEITLTGTADSRATRSRHCSPDRPRSGACPAAWFNRSSTPAVSRPTSG